MKQVTRTLAILAVSAAVGCSALTTPATPPSAEAVTLRLHGTVDTEPLVEVVSDRYPMTHAHVSFDTPIGNHVSVLSELQQGNIPYMISNHLPADSNLWAAPLARDGLAMIVHPDNPVDNLSIEQIRRIYRGHIQHWQDVGGTEEDIILYSREAGSGIRLEFERLIIGQQRISPNARVLSSVGLVLNTVASEPAAIAYVPVSLLDESVKALSVDGVAPTIENIRSNIYPLRYDLYIIGRSEPEGEYRQLVAWLQSAIGQAGLESRYAPLPN